MIGLIDPPSRQTEKPALANVGGPNPRGGAGHVDDAKAFEVVEC
jgi:hypothetical protein